jgi:hypothetical protein
MDNRFSQFTQLSKWEADLLNDAYQAVTVTGNWDSMKNFAGESFMSSSEPWTVNVMTAMQYRNHPSGASLSWSMRTIESIAKEGWNTYAARLEKK